MAPYHGVLSVRLAAETFRGKTALSLEIKSQYFSDPLLVNVGFMQHILPLQLNEIQHHEFNIYCE